MAYYEKLLGTGAMLRHTPGQTAVSCTGAAKARRIAANFAKLPEFLRRFEARVTGASRVGGDHALGKARAPSAAGLALSPNRKSMTLPQSATSSSWYLRVSQGVSRTLEPLL